MRLCQLGDDTIAHLHVSQAFAPEAVYLAHVARKLPYVAHLHIDVGPSGPAGFLLGAYKPLVLGRVLRGAQAVVVFTHEQQRSIQLKYGIDPLRIAVIPNSVEESFFFTEPRRLHSRPRILFVGRLAVQKNIPMLLHALRGISEGFDTMLVGSGDLDSELMKLAHSLELKNVRFHGRADGQALRELFRQADVFALPSEREGMPLVLLEAMAMGLPVVATDIPGSRDVVINRETGILVPLNDSNAMQKALLEVVSDERQYSRDEQGRSTQCHAILVGHDRPRVRATLCSCDSALTSLTRPAPDCQRYLLERSFDRGPGGFGRAVRIEETKPILVGTWIPAAIFIRIDVERSNPA